MKTILIVDQEKNTTFTLQKLLESESFKVYCSHNLQEATAILNTQKFDLVVVSRDMPGNGEFDVVNWLIEYSPHTHIITLSTVASVEGRNPHVLADFAKPLDFFSLVKIIKTTVKGFSGILSDISLEDYIQMFCMNGSTKAILVTRKNEKGIILIRDGNVVYAIQDRLEGEAALFRIMSWKKGTIKEVKVKKFPAANIHKDFSFLLLEGGSRLNTAEAIKPPEEPMQPITVSSISEKSDEQVRFPVANIIEPVKRKASAENGQATVPPKEKAKGGLSTPPRRKPTLKIAMVAILPLLLLIIGGKSLIFSSAWTDVPAAQNGNGMAASLATTPSPTVVPEGRSTIDQAVEKQSLQEGSKQAEIGGKGAASPKISIGKAPASVGSASTANLQDVTAVTTSPGSPKAKELTETVILRLHGSNTIGAQFAPTLAESFMKDILKAPKVEVVKGNANEVRVRAVFADRIESIEIQAHGSTTGFEGLAQNKCDIAMSSRKIKETEIEQLKVLGDMTAITNEHVIALDGIAVIVNKSNPLQKLDGQKLADIFTGKIVDWSMAQATKEPIAVYARDDKSGTFDTFKHIVLGKTELKAGVQRFESNPELSDRVAMDPAGIGFTSLPNIRKAKGLAIAEDGAEAIFPNFFTVATED